MGSDFADQRRRAADYVESHPQGREPANLPVQASMNLRAGDQHQDCERVRPDNSAWRACECRGGEANCGSICCTCSGLELAL